MSTFKIVQKPVKGDSQGKRWQIKCSDGVTYTVKSLAAKIGVEQSTMSKWLKTRDWKSPHFFTKGYGCGIPKQDRHRLEESYDTAGLGKRRNIEDIPGPTKYEEELWK